MKIRSLILNSPVFIFLVSFLVSCDTKTVYHTFQSIPEEKWEKYDTLNYTINFPDSLKSYQIDIEIRNSTSYAYENLYLFITENFRDTLVYHTDTLEYILADENGSWKGNGWGTLLQTTFPYKQCIPAHTGTHILQIIHGMKDNPLHGITNVGVRIQELE